MHDRPAALLRLTGGESVGAGRDERVDFCYTPDDLGFSVLDQELFVLQVAGHYQRNDALVEYANVELRLQAVVGEMAGNDNDPSLPQQRDDLMHRLAELRQEFVKDVQSP